MFSSSTPVPVVVRSTSVFHLLYGFANASGKGFGSTIQSSNGIRYRIGLNPSNWKEFENSLNALVTEGELGNLNNSIVFLNTDNSTVERCVYKETSSSRKLIDLVVKLKLLEVKYSCKLYISHVSGKRMI